VRRHAKASSAGSTHGIGSSRGLFGRAFVTRGASSDAEGSGAPSHRSRGIAGLLGLALIASGALFGGAAQSAVAAEATCPNEALRIQSNVNPGTLLPFSVGLPECRAYEMVSPVDKQAHHARDGRILSRDGNTVGFGIFGQLPDGEGFNQFNFSGNSFLAKRSGAGWATRATTVPSSLIQKVAGNLYVVDYSPDFSKYATCGASGGSAGASTSGAICAMRRPDGGWVATPEFPSLNGAAVDSGVTYRGASEDLSHVVFSVPPSQRLLPSDNYTGVGESIYEVIGLGTDSPVLRLVNLDNNDNQIAAPGKVLELGEAVVGAANTTYQAISDDGETIYFTTTPVGGTVPVLYARRSGTTTVATSNPTPSECTTCSATPSEAIYQGASADGSKAFFLTNQQLVNADTDSTQDLYQYDFKNSPLHHLVQVSGGGDGDLTPGTGANVSGVVRPSEDGSRTYFVATGVLTTLPNGNGQVATAGSPNLYMFERDAAHTTGLTKFVATLTSADSNLWKRNDSLRPARATPDGSFLAFATKAALTPDDLDTAADIYRYDAHTGNLVRISIGEPSFPASNNGNTAGQDSIIEGILGRGPFGAQASVNLRSNQISEDGSYVVFATLEQLQANDVDSGLDYYLWHEGAVSMISDGRSLGNTFLGAESVAMSASGEDIIFTTDTPIVGADGDDLDDIYDAKLGGGFPYTPPPPPCASVEACHGPAVAASPSAAAGTATFSGSGNPAPEKPKKKHKKHKKPHKRQHPKKHSTGKRR
jgi:hypothetical protein